MDTKSDDSGGSDSLDKTLQKKCVVDDFGQGEGVLKAQSSNASSDLTIRTTLVENELNRQSVKASDDISSNTNICSSSIDNTGIIKKDAKTNMSQIQSSHMVPSSSNTEELDSQIVATTTETTTTAETGILNNIFETKVKQISKNLKETTLAETGNQITDEMPITTSSTSISSTSSISSECSAGASHNLCNQGSEMDASMTSLNNESIDEQDNRSKKVRFHPDVKENDGGNRIIPKKKKKLKSSSGDEDASLASGSNRSLDEEMDLDEEDEADEEEEFDLAKTIAEAQDYLKSHPLTFVRPQDKNARLLQNGLLEEEDLPQVSAESSEDEDIYEQIQPENGVARILGKLSKSGQIEYLLQYADRRGIFWETNEFVDKHCPNVLSIYDQNRERRQERLMRHVAKRQNLRQRYTDF